MHALLTLLALLPGQAVGPEKVDEIVQDEMTRYKVPGVSVAVVKDGKVIHAKGYGFANLETGTPAKPDTVYQIGSVTKQFTATIIMQLRDEGKLTLDDPISKFVDDLPETWRDATLRHMLTHTSGIKSYTEVAGVMGQRGRQDATPWEVVKTVTDTPSAWKHGEKMSYNNTGYVLLGMVIEKIEGKTYATVLQDRIAKPLAMDSTRMNDWGLVIPDRATGYSIGPSGPRNANFLSMSWPYAAGAMVSSVLDLAKWDAALYGTKLLKSASLEEMWTPYKLDGGGTTGYGFGWAVKTEADHRIVEHGGGIPGFTCHLRRLPTDRITVIVLTNCESPASAQIAERVSAVYVPDLARKDEAALKREPEARKAILAVFEGARSGKLDRSLLTTEFSAFLKDEMLAASRPQLQAMGKVTGVELVKAAQMGAVTSFQYRVTLEKGAVNLRGSIDASGKVAGLMIG